MNHPYFTLGNDWTKEVRAYIVRIFPGASVYTNESGEVIIRTDRHPDGTKYKPDEIRITCAECGFGLAIFEGREVSKSGDHIILCKDCTDSLD